MHDPASSTCEAAATNHIVCHHAEVADEQLAANRATLDVLLAFTALFSPVIPADSQCTQLAQAMGLAVEGGKPLHNLPVAAMEALLATLTPQQLQHNLDSMSLNNPSTMAAGEEGECAVDGKRTNGCGASSQAPLPIPLFNQKVAVFLRELCAHRAALPAPCDLTAIIFVEQRLSALALHALLSMLPALGGWLRPSPFMAQGKSMGASSFNPRTQASILQAFRAGKINCLVSTAVAEEGIDVKSCQLVVRFDLPRNAQSFLQSRGRARMRNSSLMVLVAAGEGADAELLQQMVQYEAELREQARINMETLGDEGEEMEDEGPTEEEGECGCMPERECWKVSCSKGKTRCPYSSFGACQWLALCGRPAVDVPVCRRCGGPEGAPCSINRGSG
jgi:hypothetical protein